MQFFQFVCVSGVVIISALVFYTKVISRKNAHFAALDDTENPTSNNIQVQAKHFLDYVRPVAPLSENATETIEPGEIAETEELLAELAETNSVLDDNEIFNDTQIFTDLFSDESDTEEATTQQIQTATTQSNMPLAEAISGNEIPTMLADTAKSDEIKTVGSAAVVTTRPKYLQVRFSSYKTNSDDEDDDVGNDSDYIDTNSVHTKRKREFNSHIPIIKIVNTTIPAKTKIAASNNKLPELTQTSHATKAPICIKLTNDYRMDFKNFNIHDWTTNRYFTHLHYNTPDLETASMIAYFTTITLVDYTNSGYVFMLIKNAEHFTDHLIELFCYNLRNTIAKQAFSLKYVHLHWVGLGQKLVTFAQAIKRILSNLFDLQYDEFYSYITLKPTNFKIKYQKNSHILKLNSKATYSSEFMFFTDNDFGTEDYLSSVDEYFVSSEYFGLCQCYNNPQRNSSAIYGKLVPTDNSQNEKVVIENADQQIKIINVNNRNTLSDTLKDIIYRFAAT